MLVQGPILAFIYAVKEMLEEGQGAHASLPVNVAFVFEGEEENGGTLCATICAALARHLALTDAMCQCSTYWPVC